MATLGDDVLQLLVNEPPALMDDVLGERHRAAADPAGSSRPPTDAGMVNSSSDNVAGLLPENSALVST